MSVLSTNHTNSYLWELLFNNASFLLQEQREEAMAGYEALLGDIGLKTGDALLAYGVVMASLPFRQHDSCENGECTVYVLMMKLPKG